MITRETVDKLRADRSTLLEKAEALTKQGKLDALHSAAQDLREQLRTYTSLVEAVLDAMSVDRPANDG